MRRPHITITIIILLILAAAALVLIEGTAFTVVFLQQQASALQYTCDSIIINTTCMHQGAHYSTTQADKTPFILPFP